MYDAWKDPKTLSIISDIAGVDLIPIIDIDIGSINISVQDQGQDKGKLENQSEDDIPITNWHHDSYPFVCVVMMSDTSKMVGGETALRSGSGEIIKVRGPEMVSSFLDTSTWTSLLLLVTNVAIAQFSPSIRALLSFSKVDASRIKHLPPSEAKNVSP